MAFLMGVGMAAWLIPIGALTLDGPNNLFGLGIGLASTTSISSFLAAVFYSSQRRGFEKWQELDERARSERSDLRIQMGELQNTMLTMQQELQAQISRVSASVMQEQFNALGDAYTDLAGGQDVVEGTSTRRLPDAAVYRMPLHARGRNGRA